VSKKLKSKNKLLKQQELIAEIQEETKTFEQIAKEIEGNVQRDTKEAIAKIKEQTAEIGVRRLCNALKRDKPDITAKEIRLRVVHRMCPHIWRENYVRQFWPEWMKNPAAIDAGIAGDQGRTKKSYKNSILQEQEKEEEQTPVSSQTIWEYEDTHPKTETSPIQAKGDINRAIHTLFGRLTGINHMPHMEDDVKKQYVIDTRERAKDIINGISKIERDFLYNWLTWLGMVMDDWTDLLEKADKTAYDTRE